MSIEDDIRFFEQVSTLALLGREPLRILARSEQTTREMRKVRGKLGGTEGGK